MWRCTSQLTLFEVVIAVWIPRKQSERFLSEAELVKTYTRKQQDFQLLSLLSPFAPFFPGLFAPL